MELPSDSEGIKYRRVLLKLSGESLGDASGKAIDWKAVLKTSAWIKEIYDLGVDEIGIVVGGGNIFRGRDAAELGSTERAHADQAGMTATIVNALTLRNGLEELKLPVRVESAIQAQFADIFSHDRVMKRLKEKKIVIFGGGTGNVYCSTDSAAAQRAAEMTAQILLKASTVDGVYDKDPKKHRNAARLSTLTYTRAIADKLQVMDQNAFNTCRENRIRIAVFDYRDPCALKGIILGQESRYASIVDGE